MERRAFRISGFVMVLVLLVLTALAFTLQNGTAIGIAVGALAVVVAVLATVDDHVEYVAVQAEAAVRHLATSYPYEAHDSGRASLRDSAVVSEELTNELRERVALAGVEVLESRTTHLARFKIVEGAVGMVSNALERLREEHVVDLDEERKAQMVSNLLVVLCGDRAAQPVVNTGSLY